MKNSIMKRILSALLAFVICTNTGLVFYANNSDTEIDYDYIQDVLTEVGTIEETLNSMGISFSDVMKSEFKNEEMNEAIAEAFLSTVNKTAVSQLLDDNIEINGLKNTLKSRNIEDDVKEKIKKYSARLCYAREIAEINKKRDSKAKDIDSETVYMYISHYLDIPGGPLPLDKPVDFYSNDGLFSAWITDSDRSVYENYLSFELKNKAKEASAAFETYAQLAYKEQSLAGLIEYEESLVGMKLAMADYDQRYAHLAFLITSAAYKPLTISTINVDNIKIPVPIDFENLVEIDLIHEDGQPKISFPNVELFNAEDFINKMHVYYKEKLHIENKAMRDLYIGMGLSMAGILRYNSSIEGGASAFISGSGSVFMQYVLIDTTNQLVYDSMLVNTLVMNKDFYSYVNWLVMAYTARSRAANRLMRSLGMY